MLKREAAVSNAPSIVTIDVFAKDGPYRSVQNATNEILRCDVQVMKTPIVCCYPPCEQEYIVFGLSVCYNFDTGNFSTTHLSTLEIIIEQEKDEKEDRNENMK